jgi:hypothetical protein
MKKTVTEEKHDKDRAKQVAAWSKEWHDKKKGIKPGEKRAPLKT